MLNITNFIIAMQYREKIEELGNLLTDITKKMHVVEKSAIIMLCNVYLKRLEEFHKKPIMEITIWQKKEALKEFLNLHDFLEKNFRQNKKTGKKILRQEYFYLLGIRLAILTIATYCDLDRIKIEKIWKTLQERAEMTKALSWLRKYEEITGIVAFPENQDGTRRNDLQVLKISQWTPLKKASI